MSALLRVNTREKKVLIAGAVIVALIIIYRLTIWYGDIASATGEYVEARRVTLSKQLNKIAQKDKLQKKHDNLSCELIILERGLLSGSKAPVAAAMIQRDIKGYASTLNISIKSERALTPVDNGFYLAVPVEIGFSATTAKLKGLLYRLTTSPKLLTVSEVKIRVININDPKDAFTTLIVTRYIKKPEMKKDTDIKKDEGGDA